MNKFKLLIVALLVGTSSLFAGTFNLDVSKDEIKKQVVELVQASDASIQNQVEVMVTFTFNTDGEIVVKKVGSRDREVINFIRENLNWKKIENPGKINKDYSMRIVIK
ncbi:hypothetical protein [uncultured Lutibacter sp.]|uniref:hypothetical protein n=1 Tax=uncultured Lutibacter sp. TaxID=437739 RepID=UPI002623C606|nr:hypothetical protein [uncultured Lutibacter sp.]